ncbi:MAG TPA: ROK family protein [Stellaceae bacterium]|nr:ROK family protein [Stellaceae bacterium]
MPGPFTLSFDIGGTHLKASVLAADGTLTAEPVHVVTPHPAKPEHVVGLLQRLARRLPRYDRISVGFPGVVRDGVIISAPHLGTEDWHGFPLAAALAKRLGKPVRVLNDAEVQGFGVISGKGLELVLTLGTGLGSALFWHGRPTPHLELSQHPIHGHKTYDDYLGDAALDAKGKKKWNHHVAFALDVVRRVVNFDRLYIGGGNARKLHKELPDDVEIVSNVAGITGGVALWNPANDGLFSDAGQVSAPRGKPAKRAALRTTGRARAARRRKSAGAS